MFRAGCLSRVTAALLIHVVLVVLIYLCFVNNLTQHKAISTITGSKLFTFGRDPPGLNATLALSNSTQVPLPLILLGTEHLSWGHPWGKRLLQRPIYDSGRHTSMYDYKTCPNICRYTFNWTAYRGMADLVIINTFYYKSETAMRDLNQSTILQWQEQAEAQLWLGATRESPLNPKERGRELDWVFHWIGNYRRDADVPFSYGHFERLSKSAAVKTSSKANGDRATTKEKKLAAWLVSNCKPHSKRDVVVKTLQKFIPVDIYGKCGPRKCPEEGDCRKFLANNYKFYLAFENSLCIDYVTEKLYENLQLEIVPITYAWINDSNGSRVAPPNSYINALDFRSIKDLADYLIYLDQNEDEYQKYFKWKNEYKIRSKDSLCLACEKLVGHRRAEETSGNRISRHESMLGWMNSLPPNASGRAELRVGNNSVISTRPCIHPMENKVLKEWILGGM